MAVALNIPGSIKTLNAEPLYFYYGPWASLVTAKAGVPLGVRYDGLTVKIVGDGEYWWLQTDLTDTGLVAKSGGGSLASLSDVTLTSPLTTQFLQYDGTDWVNSYFSNPVITPTIIANAYTLQVSDQNKILHINNGSTNCTITLPNGLATNFSCTLVHKGTGGIITLVATTTLESYGTTIEIPQVGATVYHQGSNVWTAIGALGAGGGGDMILASTQTNSGAKTFLDNTLLLRNVANTFSSKFINTNSAARTYTLPNATGTVALTSNLSSWLTGTLTGDVSILGSSLYTFYLGTTGSRIYNLDVNTDILSLKANSGADYFNMGGGTLAFNSAGNGSFSAATGFSLNAGTDLYLTGTNNIYLTSTLSSFGGAVRLLNGNLTIRNPTNSFHYIFNTAAIVANRTITLPLLTGNDTFVTEAFTQTLTNKTLTSPVINTQISGTVTSGGNITTTNFLIGASATQTISGAKTFLDNTLLMRNVANTFSSRFTNTNTAARTYTLPDITGKIGIDPTTTDGDLIYHSSGELTALATGLSGETLTADGAGGYYWQAINGLIDGDKGDVTVSASGATWTIDVDITKNWTGTHTYYSTTSTRILTFFRDQVIAGNQEIGRLTFYGKNSSSGTRSYFDIVGNQTDNTAGNESSSYTFNAYSNGTPLSTISYNGATNTIAFSASLGLPPIPTASLPTPATFPRGFSFDSTLGKHVLSNGSTWNNIVTETTSATLTNKTLTSPIINYGSDAAGDLYRRNAANTGQERIPVGTNTHVLTLVAGVPTWAAPSGGGGGITNGAANTELMMSNGTNAIASGIFATAATGSLTLGSGSITGDRIIQVASSSTNANININAKADGNVYVQGTAFGVWNSTSTQILGLNARDSGLGYGPSIQPVLISGTINPFVIKGATGISGSTTGMDLSLVGGDGLLSGSTNAGSVSITSGLPNSGGTEGSVNIQSRSVGKLGFFNTTAIVKPTTGITAATFTANTSLIANDTATFDGYTIGQIVKALRNLGLLT